MLFSVTSTALPVTDMAGNPDALSVTDANLNPDATPSIINASPASGGPATHAPATDLGYLLYKHPDRVQTFDLAFGTALVYFPEATNERCTFVLQVDVDPIRLVRGRGQHYRSIWGYVNDRPYVAGSMLSVAIGRVLGSALKGRCELRPELAAAPLALMIHLPAVAARPFATYRGGEVKIGGAVLVERLFGPLGWEVTARPEPFGPPGWGDSPYLDVTLTGNVRLADALSHLYVLLPVLDGTKHYYSAAEEVDKLLRHGESWIADHPEKELITRRYLARREWADDALARLQAVDDFPDDDAARGPQVDLGDGGPGSRLRDCANRSWPTTDVTESCLPSLSSSPAPPVPIRRPPCQSNPVPSSLRPNLLAQPLRVTPLDDAAPELDDSSGRVPLKRMRLDAVLGVLRETGAHSVADVGCGEGYYLRAMLEDPMFTRILGVDVSARELERAERRLDLERRSDSQRERLTLRQSSVTYRDDALSGFDAILLVEVIEHIDPNRHESLEANVFGSARPRHVVVTTPNAEYNPFYGLAPGQRRHRDHRFEWTRARFQAWAGAVAKQYKYAVEYRMVGDQIDGVGAPTQLALFTRQEVAR